MRALLFSLALAVPCAAAETVAVPSGMAVTFHDMLWDEPGQGLVYRFRFIAPEIGLQGLAFEDVVLDMEHLCNDYALPRVSSIGPKPAQIVISLAQEPVEFGQATPDVVQYFEAYRIDDNTCMWEVF